MRTAPSFTPRVDATATEVEQERLDRLEAFFAQEVRRLAALGLQPNKRLRKQIARCARDRFTLRLRQADEAISPERQRQLDAFGELVDRLDRQPTAVDVRAPTRWPVLLPDGRRWWLP